MIKKRRKMMKKIQKKVEILMQNSEIFSVKNNQNIK